MSNTLPNIMLNIAQQDILNKFKAESKSEHPNIEVEFFYKEDKFDVWFPINDDVDLVISFKSDISYPDDFSTLCENTEVVQAVYSQSYSTEPDFECALDLGFMLQHIEEYIISKEFSKREVFFDKSCVEEKWIVDYEFNNPNEAYDASNSDFI